MAIMTIGMFGGLFYIPYFLQTVRGLGAFQTGMLMLPPNVAEALVNQLKVGQKAQIGVDTVPGVDFNGEIAFISPVSIPTGQFFPVKITVTDTDERLRAGMTVTARINTAESDFLAISNTALFKRDRRDFIYLVKDGKAVRTSVDIGLQGDKLSAIVKGLNAGDQIVVGGTDQVIEGMALPEKQ